MSIQRVGSIPDISGISDLKSTRKSQEVDSSSFSDILSTFIQDADNNYAVASADTSAILSGEVDNIAQVMMNGSKAQLSLSLVTKVRDVMLESYRQVMSMQV